MIKVESEENKEYIPETEGDTQSKGHRSIRVITTSSEFKPQMVKDTEFVSDKHLFKLAKLMHENGLKC